MAITGSTVGRAPAPPAATTSTAGVNTGGVSTPDINSYAQTVYNDLNTNNFAGAWSTALSTSPLYGTNYGSATKDPLLQILESSAGLKAFDPNKIWTPQEEQNFYNAFNDNAVYHGQQVKGIGGGTESLGKNPYGLWGSAGAISNGSDAAANLKQEGVTPDIERFVGARPSTNVISKYGPMVAMLAAAVAAPEAIGALAPALGGGVLGAAGAGAIYGAGTGALGGALSGGNIGKDALLGAVGGGIMGGTNAEFQQLGLPGGSLVGKVASNEATGLINGQPGNTNMAGVSPIYGGTGGSPSGGGQYGSVYGAPNGGATGYSGGSTGTSSPTFDFNSIGSTIGSLIGPAAGVYGAQNNAEKQSQWINTAIGTQTGAQNTINGIWAPQAAAGNAADTALTSLTSGGPGGTPNYAAFENMPGYQFAINSGTQAIQRAAAASGGAFTPNTLTNVGQFVTGTAMSDYNTYVNQLLSQAQLGQGANTGLTGANLTTSGNISQLQQNEGVSQGAGASNTGNIIGSAFNSGMGGAVGGLINKGISSLFGGSSGGNGGGTPSYNTSGYNGGSVSNYGGSGGLYGDNTGSTTDLSNITGGVDPNAFGSYSGFDPNALSASNFDPNSISTDLGNIFGSG